MRRPDPHLPVSNGWTLTVRIFHWESVDVLDFVPGGRIDHRLCHLATTFVTIRPGAYHLPWLIPLIDQDRHLQAKIRRLERILGTLLDLHGTALGDEPGIGPVNAAVLLCETGDPARFATEAKFARRCGTGAVALSSGDRTGEPTRHRVDFRGNRTVNSMIYTKSITEHLYHPVRRQNRQTREARRVHKRHLANRVIRRMWRDKHARQQAH